MLIQVKDKEDGSDDENSVAVIPVGERDALIPGRTRLLPWD